MTRHRLPLFATGVLALAAAWLAVPPAPGQEPAAAKYALLVGVQEYEHPNLPALRYAERDAAELAKVLAGSGYQVTLLCDGAGKNDPARAPTKANIEKHLHGILEGCKKGDTVVLAFAGHGLQFEGTKDAFFCPKDARPFPDETATLLSLTGVYERLERSFAGAKILLVDACRNDPTRGRGGRSGIDPKGVRAPDGVAALFSCNAGEIAYEHEDFQHGVFFHFVLEGLRGAAKNGDGNVTFNALADYVTGRVAQAVPKLVGGGAKQSPNQVANLVGASPVLVAAAKAAAEDPLIAAMKFVRVPKGTFWMGWDWANKQSKQVTIGADFELAAYAVTQAQWQAVMATNPSAFSRQGQDKDKVKDVSDADLARFPVEEVSWKDVQAFLKKLNEREKGKGWTYRLPTEAEWEYACRGAATSKEACSFDFYLERPTNDLSSRQANCQGDYPAGKGAKGPNLGRPSPVGSYPPNPLGLYDMHGNVWQWCSDLYEAAGADRVIRGGSWYNGGEFCRAAFRARRPPSSRDVMLGCRLARVASGGKE